MMDANLKREIIMDNYEHPFNKQEVKNNDYIIIRSNNESCIDDINLYILIKDDIIVDLKFEGEACAISTSSTSIMIKMLIGKNIDEIEILYECFKKMVNGEEYEKDILGEAQVYNEIYKQANRKNCALLPWTGIMKGINKYREEK